MAGVNEIRVAVWWQTNLLLQKSWPSPCSVRIGDEPGSTQDDGYLALPLAMLGLEDEHTLVQADREGGTLFLWPHASVEIDSERQGTTAHHRAEDVPYRTSPVNRSIRLSPGDHARLQFGAFTVEITLFPRADRTRKAGLPSARWLGALALSCAVHLGSLASASFFSPDTYDPEEDIDWALRQRLLLRAEQASEPQETDYLPRAEGCEGEFCCECGFVGTGFCPCSREKPAPLSREQIWRGYPGQSTWRYTPPRPAPGYFTVDLISANLFVLPPWSYGFSGDIVSGFLPGISEPLPREYSALIGPVFDENGRESSSWCSTPAACSASRGRVRIEGVQVRGPLDLEAAALALKQLTPRLSVCRGRTVFPDRTSWRFHFSMRVDRQGSISELSVGGDGVRDLWMERCLGDVLKEIPAMPAARGIADVRFGVRFTP